MSDHMQLDGNTRIGTIGGTLLMTILNIFHNDLVRTIGFAVNGASVSFFASLFWRWAVGMTEVIATYDNQFYKGKAAVVKRTFGKGDVTYIGADTDDSKLEKDIIKERYTRAGATTNDYPEGVFVFWRDGFF